MDMLFPSVCHQLTLTKINNSQDEMSYITRMRNAIKFQIENTEDYKYLKYYDFQHIILCPLTRRFELELCLRHTHTQSLLKVVKFQVLMHNYTPFLQWPTIIIDHDHFPEQQNPDKKEKCIRSVDTYEKSKRYLVTIFKNPRRYYFVNSWCVWNLLKSHIFMNTRLDNRQINSEEYLNSIQTSIWRRVYANNYTYFCSSDTNIAVYVKEQMQRTISDYVLNEIIKRQRGECFNQFGVLENLAGPYYYVLPHQVERDNQRIKQFIQLIFKIIDKSYAGEMFSFHIVN
ncbi:uncharacterized protein TNIN_164881 [Trichonephila inaurata madagascariensis]|uniref:Uncharacterized protein n=1 Tax=Trichonephila inaurata madagascariensis TaxID=2747483 RepID=A0A8X6X8B3_9ARAC|nr:uncharacterized protein TNIN_164881 [Trichonephila inaurata madagascariensis]